MACIKWTPPVVLLLSVLLPLAGAAGADEPVIAYPDALDAAAVSVERLESILEDALIVGNGDLNALVYTEAGQLRIKLTKNDVWDARFDAKLDPPLPKFEWVTRLASQPPPHGGSSTILKDGWGKHGDDAYHSHAYPCQRACALVVISESTALAGTDGSLPVDLSAEALAPASPSARLDLRRAVARVASSTGAEPPTEVRILAQSNVVLINAAHAGRLLPVGSSDLPKVESGERDGVAWIVQQIPGDPDWPGMSFAVASVSEKDRTVVAVVTSREAEDPRAAAIELARSTLAQDTAVVIRRHEAEWTRFWSASGVDLADSFLRDVWYRNLYFLRCVTRPGAIAPGLFAGLIHDRPAWHGDYHTNYNIQQTFWSAYSTNHPDLAEPYDRLISEYLPRAKWLARQVFGFDGAYYPHVLFAYEPPHPEKCKSPNGRQYIHHVWGFTQGVSGFTVQPLWWHYKYAPDRKLLENVVYPAVRDIAVFQAELMDGCARTDAGQIVLGPSVSPEHWGWTKDFARNRNGTFDIAMFRYMFQAAIEAATTLDCDADLRARWRKALGQLPPYPTTGGEQPVVVDVQDAPPITYNIAVPAVPVFPGDVVTWFSPPAEKELFTRTIEGCRWNGNNSAIILAVARARLSMPGTLDWLRTELESRLRPNGTLTLNRLGHRFNDFGHYTEQFGASMVVGELLLQSVGDIVRVFPAWPKDKPAQFHNLRAQGGFLVAAVMADGGVKHVAVTSTVGGRLRLLSPWQKITVVRNGKPEALATDERGIVILETRPDDQMVFAAPARNDG
jgi:hypothetical protein